MLTFKKHYFVLAISIFIIEVLIARYLTDNFVRPYVGDLLVVILLYCFIKAFLDVPVVPVAIFVLVFAFAIEFLQYIRIVEILGLQHSKIARIVIGTLFKWRDLVAYSLGTLLILLAERKSKNAMQKFKVENEDPSSTSQ